MNIIVINLLDLLIIAHALGFFFTTVHPIRNKKLIGFLNTICAPMNRFVSQFASLTLLGRRVETSALSAICLAFVRLAVSALV
jgi:hypothetical protein